MKRRALLERPLLLAALMAGLAISQSARVEANSGLIITTDPSILRKVDGYANVNPQQPPPPSIVFTTATTADLAGPTVPPGPYPNVWGIFLGISDYKNYTDLANPVNDARTLSQTLVNVAGLRDPIVLLNDKVTTQNVENALAEIGKRAGEGDLVIFHYSGHGVALKSTTGDARPRGYMLMADAAPPKEAFSSQNSLYGFVDMTNLERMMHNAGIRSKHTVFVLDCCFGGMGAEYEAFVPNRVMTRSLTGPPPVLDETTTVNTMLRDRGLLFMAAGDGSQEVLDISVDYEGYGLLSGYLIQAIQYPTYFGIRPLNTPDGQYLSTQELATGSRRVIPMRAENTLNALVKQFAKDAGIEQPTLAQLASFTEADFAPLDPKIARNLKAVRALHGNTQNPQFLPKMRGVPLIPVRNPIATPTPTPALTPTPAAATPTPSLTPRPTPTMVPTPVPQTPTPTPEVAPTPTVRPTMTPTPTPPPDGVPFYRQYAQDVGRHYSDTEYGKAVGDVFHLLYTGVPPKPSKADNDLVRIAADVFARPSISNETWNSIYGLERFNLDRTRTSWQSEEIKWRENWRSQHNLQFTVIPYTGYQLSENYVLRFRLANYDTDPLYYYFLAFDDAGILQWVAPKDFDGVEINKSWKDNIGNFASGEAPLRTNRVYDFPGNDPKTGAPGFVPLEGDNDQWLFLVVSETRWPELERALDRATAISFKHYNNTQPTAPKRRRVESNARLELRVRSLGRPSVETPAEQVVQNPRIDYITRNEGHYRILTWNIDMVPGPQLQPMLYLSRQN